MSADIDNTEFIKFVCDHGLYGKDWAVAKAAYDLGRLVALSGKGDAGIDWIGGVLSYDTKGHNRACGQTIGGNGAGEFIIIYRGTPEQASEAAHAHIRALEASGYRFNNVTFVQSGDAYYGPSIKVVATPQTAPSQANSAPICDKCGDMGIILPRQIGDALVHCDCAAGVQAKSEGDAT